MKKQIFLGSRKVLVTLIYYLSAILAAMLLAIFGQIADWVAQVVVALSLLRLAVLFGWGVCKQGWGWRV